MSSSKIHLILVRRLNFLNRF